MPMPAQRLDPRRWTEKQFYAAEHLVWHPVGASEPFVLDLVNFFAEIAVPETRTET